VFETSASTDSAIWATVFLNCGAKIWRFIQSSKFSVSFFFYLYKKEQKTRLYSPVTGAA